MSSHPAAVVCKQGAAKVEVVLFCAESLLRLRFVVPNFVGGDVTAPPILSAGSADCLCYVLQVLQ